MKLDFELSVPSLHHCYIQVCIVNSILIDFHFFADTSRIWPNPWFNGEIFRTLADQLDNNLPYTPLPRFNDDRFCTGNHEVVYRLQNNRQKHKISHRKRTAHTFLVVCFDSTENDDCAESFQYFFELVRGTRNICIVFRSAWYQDCYRPVPPINLLVYLEYSDGRLHKRVDARADCWFSFPVILS